MILANASLARMLIHIVVPPTPLREWLSFHFLYKHTAEIG